MASLRSVAFENLRAEMARERLSVLDIAQFLGISRQTLSEKFSRRRPITLNEAFRITNRFFPEQDVYYLFKELVPENCNRSA